VERQRAPLRRRSRCQSLSVGAPAKERRCAHQRQTVRPPKTDGRLDSQGTLVRRSYVAAVSQRLSGGAPAKHVREAGQSGDSGATQLCGSSVPSCALVRRAECARTHAARTVRSTRAHVAPASSSWHKVSTSWQDGPIVTMTAPRTHQFARPQHPAAANMLLQPVPCCTSQSGTMPSAVHSLPALSPVLRLSIRSTPRRCDYMLTQSRSQCRERVLPARLQRLQRLQHQHTAAGKAERAKHCSMQSIYANREQHAL